MHNQSMCLAMVHMAIPDREPERSRWQETEIPTDKMTIALTTALTIDRQAIRQYCLPPSPCPGITIRYTASSMH